MKQLISLLLGVIVSATLFCAAGYPMEEMGKAVADNAGTAVSAPTALHLMIVKDGFQLTWALSPQDPGPVTGYEIVRADVFSGPYETVGTVKQGITSFVDRTAKPEVIYFYKLRALAGSQQSPFSREASGELTKGM